MGHAMAAPSSPIRIVSRTWRVTGQVQGVGFRPFVYRLARDLELGGSVRNDPTGVTIVARGPARRLDEFAARLSTDAPALASVDDVQCLEEHEESRDGERAFSIVPSDHAPAMRGRITVDSATCPDCLREMSDPENRRYGHALINCTNCGPRYSIICDLPYDRPLTTMAPFPMCPACEAEYHDPADRRFHAQPTCCPACGPRLRLVDTRGVEMEGDAVRRAASLLREGAVLAMKGIGGYHLVVSARDEPAVARLRRGKRRDHKPFAVMVPDLEAARALVTLSREAEARLASPARPIVLAHRRPGEGVAPSVAPANHRLGLILPYTPMQHLLFAQDPGPLVMTSANHSDDPLLADDREVLESLGAICDALLVHDRRIERVVDDSILLDAPTGLRPIRRARGYVPAPLTLPVASPSPGLCVGGELKNTVAIVRGAETVLSQHIGDLGYTLAYRRFERTIDDLLRLFEIAPAWIACDPHPGYLSHRFALREGRAADIEVIEVQHHHAHLASVLAENGRSERTLGLVCDGVGYGAGGETWGGEILVGDLLGYERLGRLRPLRLPGGDAAAKETGRCALSWLWDLLGADALTHPLATVALPDAERRRAVGELLERDLNCPPSSGMGRLFDAAAALLGICVFNHHEAMSGMRMEAEADRARAHPSGRGVVAVADSHDPGGLVEMDTRGLLEALLSAVKRGRPEAETAWFVHDALADGLYRAARIAAERTGIRTVALSGGVFANALLTERVTARLEPDGFDVLVHGEVPPNDGGIAYGQAAVAAATLAARRNERER